MSEGRKEGGVVEELLYWRRSQTFFRLSHERQMSERINYRHTPNPLPLINE